VKDVVERIWARDSGVWTGAEEGRWLGWLDVPWRMREDVDLLPQFADSVVDRVDDVVLLGMGGSSLAPEVIKRTFRQETFHVLDTTHPQAIRALEGGQDIDYQGASGPINIEPIQSDAGGNPTAGFYDVFRYRNGKLEIFGQTAVPGSGIVKIKPEVQNPFPTPKVKKGATGATGASGASGASGPTGKKNKQSKSKKSKR